MKFDANQIRSTRKVMQWSVLPMAILAVLTLSHPLLPLLLCLLALVTLLCAVSAGLVEEQVAERGSPWLWRTARRIQSTITKTVVWYGSEGSYRDMPRPERRVVFERKSHWFKVLVTMMPTWMGGGGLGWKLGWRFAKRTFIRRNNTRVDRNNKRADFSDRIIQIILNELRRSERLDYVRSTHVGCSGADCTHCNGIVDGMGR